MPSIIYGSMNAVSIFIISNCSALSDPSDRSGHNPTAGHWVPIFDSAGQPKF
jgi:hypothetical protein